MQPQGIVALEQGAFFSPNEVQNLLLSYGYPPNDDTTFPWTNFPRSQSCASEGHKYLLFKRTTQYDALCKRHICVHCLLSVKITCQGSPSQNPTLVLVNGSAGPRHHELEFLDPSNRQCIKLRFINPAFRPIVFRLPSKPLLSMIAMVETLLTNLLDDATQDKKYRTVKKKNVKLEAALNVIWDWWVGSRSPKPQREPRQNFKLDNNAR